MAASASLTIPVTLANPNALYDVTSVLQATAGVSDLAVDAATSKATLGYQFPGSLDSIMRKLRSRGLSAAKTIDISVPVKNLSGKTIDAVQFLSHLNASPAITGANYDGKTVSATIVPMTASMRYVYEEIIIAGLTAIDMPTVAGPQEFVL
jgi:hypothetical protein